MHAGVRELKARLSQLLQQVEAGTTITAQAHNRPVAEIVPIRISADWESIRRVKLTESALRLAEETAETYELRGFDRFHLASALSLRDRTNLSFVFAVFDQRPRDGTVHAGLALSP